MRGGRKTGGASWGGMPLGGGVIFEGQASGVFVHRWARAREWGGGWPSTSLRKEGGRGRGGRKEEQSIEL